MEGFEQRFDALRLALKNHSGCSEDNGLDGTQDLELGGQLGGQGVAKEMTELLEEYSTMRD